MEEDAPDERDEGPGERGDGEHRARGRGSVGVGRRCGIDNVGGKWGGRRRRREAEVEVVGVGGLGKAAALPLRVGLRRNRRAECEAEEEIEKKRNRATPQSRG